MADNENLEAASHSPSEEVEPVAVPSGAATDPPSPERLRVHSLARALGTTSKRIIEALVELDGRTRSAHSTLAREEADRVREALSGSESESGPGSGPITDPASEEEPESRLILETHASDQSEAADYLPLFVAPQPVESKDEQDGGDDEDDDADDVPESDDEGGDRPAAKRRRRGRRGRGRGRGEQNGDEPPSDSDSDGGEQSNDGRSSSGADSENDSDSGDSGPGSDGGKTRRRRRKRRKSGSGDDTSGGSSPDDPPNTVVHERAPRRAKGGDGDSSNHEIQGISGSTRLEAKRQRRRDGRDAGRRRPPILSEAEFLARREAVERTMVVRDKVRAEPPHQGARYTQIAVLEDGVVVEHFVTSAASASLVGNIYLGIVQNVLPSMEAAFVDIGRGRNGVLYAGEVYWEAAGLGGAQR